MYSIVVTVPFEAAHRIMGHQGKCRHLHGHSYRAEVHIEGPTLDRLGMLIDFGQAKGVIKDWIDLYWDHNTILAYDDPLPKLGRLLKDQNIWSDKNAWNDGKEPYLLAHTEKFCTQPTAENMARELYEILKPRFRSKISKVTIYEGFGGFASYEPV